MLQVVRDMGLVVPDFCAVIVFMMELKNLSASRKIRIRSLFYKEELMFCGFVTTLLIVVGKSLGV